MRLSVFLRVALGLWITFRHKISALTTPSGNCGFSEGVFRTFLRRFSGCQLLQVVLVKVETAGYQPQLQNHAVYSSSA